MKRIRSVLILWLTLAFVCLTQTKRAFTVEDDIGLRQFGDIWTGAGTEPLLSPDGNSVLVHTTYGSLGDGKIHDELRIYSVPEIREALDTNEPPPQPLWSVRVACVPNDAGDPAINSETWVGNHSIAFLRFSDNGARQLVLGNISDRSLTILTKSDQDVRSFAIRDRLHFVYTVPSESYLTAERSSLALPSRIGTGQMLPVLLYPQRYLKEVGRGDLWSSEPGGKPHAVLDSSTHEPISLYGDGERSLALSPDGKILITVRPVATVPESWPQAYPSPSGTPNLHLKSGPQNLDLAFGLGYVNEFVQISLPSGEVTPLIYAPTAFSAGWLEGGFGPAVWSEDGTAIYLPGVFINQSGDGQDRPCLAIAESKSRRIQCLRSLHRNLPHGFEAGYDQIGNAQFEGASSNHVLLIPRNEGAQGPEAESFTRRSDGVWRRAAETKMEPPPVAFAIHSSPSFPPKLVAYEPRSSRNLVVYDPNPQLADVAMGDISEFHWNDGLGHAWSGLLYRPPHMKPGVRYPLVIQNHGVLQNTFAPSGEFPTAFAAEELAAAGMIVLQVRDCAGRATVSEGPCNVAAYDSAVASLSEQGMVDPKRVGVIGFSRTVFYTMDALTEGRVHYAAASITDGLSGSYLDYLIGVSDSPFYTRDYEGLMGGPPLGASLLDWIHRSPEFNTDSVDTPVRVVALRELGVLGMWEPYALLRAAHKPVELTILNTRQHVINDPRVREAAQQGNVDWFRFWLQGYEDPDPAKRSQYARWGQLRERFNSSYVPMRGTDVR